MKKILDQLQELLAEGNALLVPSRDITAKPDAERETYFARRTRWLTNCVAVLRFGNLNDYEKYLLEANASHSYETFKVSQIVAHLESACDMIRAGFLGKLVHLVHAEFSSSLLDQADDLFRSGHYVPAAVLSRIVVERWLRDESDRHGIANFDSEKASALNDQLKKAGAFSTPKWRQVQAALDVGNAAAHGKTGTLTPEDVLRAIAFARATCL